MKSLTLNHIHDIQNLNGDMFYITKQSNFKLDICEDSIKFCGYTVFSDIDLPMLTNYSIREIIINRIKGGFLQGISKLCKNL